MGESRFAPPKAQGAPQSHEQEHTVKPVVPKDTIGKIPNELGRGDDAKNSLIYLTIKWAFLVGAGATTIVAINAWYFKDCNKINDIVGDLKSVWSIVLPIITLALGYAFGKHETAK